ncbi:hypothetical protein BH11PLA2_BH11PLA2_32500 [soil metagenome]
MTLTETTYGECMTPTETTAAATVRIADAAETSVEKSTGVKGSLGTWLQMGFGGVVAIAMMYMMNNQTTQLQELQKNSIEQAREERTLYRESMSHMRIDAAQMRMDAEAKYIRTESSHKDAMGKMGQTIERAVTSLEKATDVMVETNRVKARGGMMDP